MNELQVNTESLYQEAEKTIESIRKLKQILERQRNIIKKMGGYWNGEGYEAATKKYGKSKSGYYFKASRLYFRLIVLNYIYQGL